MENNATKNIAKWGWKIKAILVVTLFLPFAVIAQQPNDDADSAILLTLGAGCGALFNNYNATASPGEPTASCRSAWQNGAVFRPVWFKFIAPASGAVKISSDHNGSMVQSGTRIGVFSAIDSSDYSTFTILHCAGNSGVSAPYSNILYPTGLTAGNTYYIGLDVYYEDTSGTFCVTVDELDASMISTAPADCVEGVTPNNNPWTGIDGDYHGWISLIDADGNLNANIRQITGDAKVFRCQRTVKTGTLRSDMQGQPYLNRNFQISSVENNDISGNITSAELQLFFTNAELNESGVALNALNVSRMMNATCSPDFHGSATFLTQTANGNPNGVNWIQVPTTTLSNFFIHKGDKPLPIIAPEDLGNKITASPNPVRDYLQIKISQSMTQGNVQITDMCGKIIYQNQHKIEGNIINLDMHMLPSGYYYVRYTDASNARTFKIVKQ